ncbi:hypothetical protein Vadar_011927 [Vaccinium darrowii]|uniref:Uncharacterized protein n=1 Tax=Vaccinium darrowii TaxID=229202 RepID=A0ACB7XQ21_9ERIC|nr:hypothetical protein Vadar_011927 [Vaccinium darrowii]
MNHLRLSHINLETEHDAQWEFEKRKRREKEEGSAKNHMRVTGPIRFHPKNSHSLLPYAHGSVIFFDGEPKEGHCSSIVTWRGSPLQASFSNRMLLLKRGMRCLLEITFVIGRSS